MRSTKQYFDDFFGGLGSLLKGMRITLREFFTKKTTEQYPENRATLKMFDRFRGELVMIHTPDNKHRCIACGLCEMNCPNGTIRVESEMITGEDGKKKKVLIRYLYDHGSCIYCQLCTKSCPQHAIEFIPTFEHAVFTREKLLTQLNRKGSKTESPKTDTQANEQANKQTVE